LLLQTCLWCDHGVYRPVSKDNVWLLVDATPQKIVNNSVQQVMYFYRYNFKKEAELALVEKRKIKEINLTKIENS
jgi:hypothetical protein